MVKELNCTEGAQAVWVLYGLVASLHELKRKKLRAKNKPMFLYMNLFSDSFS